MAFVVPLGKLSFLVGAGILGSVLGKEQQIPSVSDVFSTAFKFIKPSGSSSSSTNPKDDALMAQVNNLKQELQFLVSNRPVTFVTSGEGGSRRYGVIILVVAVGYGYIWWKGWKLPDITFATKRGLSDACTAIATQLEQVYSSITVTKRDLSSRIERADSSLNNLTEENDCTRNEERPFSTEIDKTSIKEISEIVSLLHGEMGTFDVNIQSVREVVESLESRILSMQENGDAINFRVMRLVNVANTERRRTQEALQGTPSSGSTPAREHPPQTLSMVLPPPSPGQFSELPSPSSSVSNELNGTAPSASGLRDIHEFPQAVNAGLRSRVISNDNGNGSPLLEGANRSATGGFFSRFIPNNMSFVSRTRSVTK